MKAHLILYVRDQGRSKKFYSSVLAQEPILDVPGMTEFALSPTCVLGLMPVLGVKLLLGRALPDPERGSGIPRAELYLHVEDPDVFHQRSIEMGATRLSALAPRNWGDQVAYSLDPDGHVLAFASTIEKS